MPPHITTYPINQEVAKKKGLRKYGFHGISYSFILSATAKHLGKKEEDTSLIVLHLGSGASACAIKKGKSWDTTMGLTPLAGLPGATRSGSIDPSLVFHYTSEAGSLSQGSTKEMHISTAEDILNKKSGWSALTGTTDFHEITTKAGEGDKTCKLAFDIFIDRILGFIGSYYVSLGGKVDALVFAGGIGEKSGELREAIGNGVECLGFEVDDNKNKNVGDGVVEDIGVEGGKGGRVLVCQTDEQFEMARQCSKYPKVWEA
jgi:acetate kinase